MLTIFKIKYAAGIVGAIAIAASLMTVAPAQSAELKKLRFAYLLSDTLLPIFRAKEKGYFEAEGIDISLVPVQGGPAVVAALASGEADVGYAAPVPPINAIAKGVPIKLLLTLGHEVDPDRKYVWLVASKASGVKSLADVKGKKIAINGNGTGCELAWRDHLANAGISYSDVQVVVLPFPQQEAALEQGTIDVACAIQPFFASINTNKAIEGTVIAKGLLANEKEPIISDSIFGTDSWIKDNQDTIKGFGRALLKARAELLADRSQVDSDAVKYLDLTPDLAKTLDFSVYKPEINVAPAELQRILDALVKATILKAPLKAEDISLNLQF